MEEKSKKLIIDAIVTSLISSIILFMLNSCVYLFDKEKANVVFLSVQKESSYIQIEKYLVTAFIYFLEFAVMLTINKRYYDKKRRESQEECNRLEKIVNQTENTIKELSRQQLRIKLKLQKRIIDYSKELKFWKNTIRKLLYKSKENKIADDDVFQIVTKNLKTYQTLEKCNYEDIEDTITEIKDIKE